ncbi:MAG: metal-dependent hydrolase [Syntrophobacterales bacterium]|nr:MAG: metal-dependent hydrolase [Syntrophobacterales bacterium]
MDTTTHALAGYMIAKTGLSRDTGKWGTIAGVSAAIFPDMDLVLRPFISAEFMLKYHRHLTNSFLLIIPFSLLFAWLFVKISRVRRFWTFFLIWAVELLAHTFLDLITSYGTMVLSPFFDYRFTLDWVFIIDLFLVSSFLFPLIALHIWKRRSQTLARVSVVLAALYISLCAYNHSWSLSLAESYTRQEGLVTEAVASLPQPFSPFNWGNYIVTEKKIYQGLVNLIGAEEKSAGDGNFLSRFLDRYQPVPRLQYREWDRFDNSPWVEKALRLGGVKTFYWFARFPVARDRGVVNGNQRVEFFDLRFGSIDGIRPFLYVVDFDSEGNVAFQGFL